MAEQNYWNKVLSGRVSRRRAIIATGGAAAAAAFLAACGGSDSGGSSGSSNASGGLGFGGALIQPNPGPEPVTPGPFMCPPAQWDCSQTPAQCDQGQGDYILPDKECACDPKRPITEADCAADEDFVCRGASYASDGAPLTSTVAFECTCVPHQTGCRGACQKAFAITGTCTSG